MEPISRNAQGNRLFQCRVESKLPISFSLVRVRGRTGFAEAPEIDAFERGFPKAGAPRHPVGLDI